MDTLPKLTDSSSKEAAFLGDANFPDYAVGVESTLGSQIHLFTKIFQRYSRLEFSHIEDRPIAIDGLMDRLTDAFQTQSIAGLFKTFWGRCLLWKRAEDVARLKRIPRGAHTKKVPLNWSWMAHEGGIAFLEPKGDSMDWNEEGIQLPFATRPQLSWLKTSYSHASNAIVANAFDFDHLDNGKNGESYMSYDDGEPSPPAPVKCVIIGSEKGHTMNSTTRKHYVVLVSRIVPTDDEMYERVGVGYMLEKSIKLAKKPVSIRIE